VDLAEATTGIVRIDDAFDPGDAARMVDDVWELLRAKHGIRRHDRSTWPSAPVADLAALRRGDTFGAVLTDRVRSSVGEVLDPRPWQLREPWGQVLLTFPSDRRIGWSVPAEHWHVDLAPDGRSEVVLRMFGFLAPVPPGGGGTLVVEGSAAAVAALHRRQPLRRSKEVKPALRASHPWWELLFAGDRDLDPGARDAALLAGADVEGGHVRVVELTGEPGDVVLMHPWTVHAGSTNTSDAPRFMVTGSALDVR
jgi:hypothetical protein